MVKKSIAFIEPELPDDEPLLSSPKNAASTGSKNGAKKAPDAVKGPKAEKGSKVEKGSKAVTKPDPVTVPEPEKTPET